MNQKTKDRLTRQVDEGTVSEHVLNALENAFTALEEDCFEAFKRSDMHDDEGRRSCRYYIRVMEDVKSRFTKAVRTGEAARKKLIRLKEDK